MRNLETNSDMLKPGRDPDGYCFYFFISTFNFLITANILKFRHELPESNINSALSSKAAIKGPIVSDFAVKHKVYVTWQSRYVDRLLRILLFSHAAPVRPLTLPSCPPDW